MKKIVKSPKKQSAKITKLKMRVGEIANMLLQNNPKMVRMRSGGSSGYADLFMSKQLMKGGMTDGTQTAIVDFLNKDQTVQAVKELKTQLIPNIPDDLEKGEDLKNELNNDNVYDYNLCDKYDGVADENLKDDLITLDIVNKFYKLVDKKPDSVSGIKLNRDKFKNKTPVVDAEGRPAAGQVELPTGDGAGAAGQVEAVDEAAAAAEPGKKFNRGDIVTIGNLMNNKEYNGVNGRINSYIQATDRWVVLFNYKKQKKKMAFKSHNLTKKEDVVATGDDDNYNDYLQTIDINKSPLDKESYLAKLNEDKKKLEQLGGGKPPAKYKSTGRIVHIMYKKRNYKRTVYVKGKRNTKYCKIDGEYILLSKMKMIA